MLNFDEYIRQGEPDKRERGQNWQIAIGLQAVDGLTPSAYLLDIARLNIEGEITLAEAKRRVDNYYKTSPPRPEGDRTEEADKVSVSITEVLSEKTFSFSPVEYIGIHRRIFKGVYKFAGKLRDYNISKQEWVLDGATVFYASAPLIRETLDYDFREEREFSYKGLTQKQLVEHIAKFISGVWQIHPFGEGNTRTTAVFTIKYLRTFGFAVDNEPFAEHSWYFRNALVRANYEDPSRGIQRTTKYLDRFFLKILFDEPFVLRNREMHIRRVDNLETNIVSRDTINDTLNLGDDTLLELIKSTPRITAEGIAERLGVSLATAKRRVKVLKDAGRIQRVGSKKTGHWHT